MVLVSRSAVLVLVLVLQKWSCITSLVRAAVPRLFHRKYFLVSALRCFVAAGTIHSAARHDASTRDTGRLQVRSDHYSLNVVLVVVAAIHCDSSVFARWWYQSLAGQWQRCSSPVHYDFFYHANAPVQLKTGRTTSKC